MQIDTEDSLKPRGPKTREIHINPPTSPQLRPHCLDSSPYTGGDAASLDRHSSDPLTPYASTLLAREPNMSPLRTARSFAKTAQPEAELRSPLRSAGLGSPVRRPPAPPAGAAFDPARPIFDPARPGLYVCHRSERPKILGAHTCAEYRGVFRSIAQALTKAQPGDTVHVSGGVYDESLAIAISVLIRALPGEEVVLRSAAAGDTSLVSSEAPFARLERISLEHSGGDPAPTAPAASASARAS